MRVLVIEDEPGPDPGAGAGPSQKEGYAARPGRRRPRRAREGEGCEYEAIVLDLTLPGIGGLEVLGGCAASPEDPGADPHAPATASAIASPGSTPAPMIIWSSRSPSRRCWPGSGR